MAATLSPCRTSVTLRKPQICAFAEFHTDRFSHTDWPYSQECRLVLPDVEVITAVDKLYTFVSDLYAELGVRISDEPIAVYQVDPKPGRKIVKGWASPYVRAMALSTDTAQALLTNPEGSVARLTAEAIIVHELGHVCGFLKEDPLASHTVIHEGLNKYRLDASAPGSSLSVIGSITAEEYLVSKISDNYVQSRGALGRHWENLCQFTMQLRDKRFIEVISILTESLPPEFFELEAMNDSGEAQLRVVLSGYGAGFPEIGGINLGGATEHFGYWDCFGYVAGGANEDGLFEFQSRLLAAQVTGVRTPLYELIAENLGDEACVFIEKAPFSNKSINGVLGLALNQAYALNALDPDDGKRRDGFKRLNEAMDLLAQVPRSQKLILRKSAEFEGVVESRAAEC